MSDNTIQELKTAIKNKKVLLFVGSGISCSVGLPSWDQLIEILAQKMKIDIDLFKMLGDNLALAEYCAIQIDKKSNENEPVSKTICNIVETYEKNNLHKIKNSKVYQKIVDLDCPIIYTTNYDHCLEQAYELNEKKEYNTIKNLTDIASFKPNSTQIIKIHGDYNHHEDIVFTESSYFDRIDFESPLDIKLRADMLNKTILFIGYSLSDINIRLLIHKLDKIWKKDRLFATEASSNRPKSYIFMARPNYVQEEILKKRGIIPIIGSNVDPQISTELFLEAIMP